MLSEREGVRNLGSRSRQVFFTTKRKGLGWSDMNRIEPSAEAESSWLSELFSLLQIDGLNPLPENLPTDVDCLG